MHQILFPLEFQCFHVSIKLVCATIISLLGISVETYMLCHPTFGIIENYFMINEEYKNISNPIQQAIVKVESHPSSYLIKNKTANGNNFKLEPVLSSGIKSQIRLLNTKKETAHDNILSKILKSSSETTVNVFHRLFNEAKTKGEVLDNL